MMLLGIDHDHGMTNSTSEFFVARTLDRHVRDQVADLAHLLVLEPRRKALALRDVDLTGLSVVVTTINRLHPVVRRERSARVEVLQALEWGLGLDQSLAVGDHENMIAI